MRDDDRGTSRPAFEDGQPPAGGPWVIGGGSSLEADRLRAEALLYGLAAELRRVAINDETRDLHLRALRIKRDIGRWPIAGPSSDTRHRILEELEALGSRVTRLGRDHAAEGPRRGSLRGSGGGHDDGTT